MQQYKILYFWCGLYSEHTVIKGYVWATDLYQVAHRLYKLNIVPIDIKTTWWMLAYPPYWWRGWVALQRRDRLWPGEVAFFCKTVAVLMRGHFSFYDAVRLVSVSAPSAAVQASSVVLLEQLSRGQSITEAFCANPNRWPAIVPLACGAVAGVGAIHEVFLYLANAFELSVKYRSDIGKAVLMPLLTASVVIVVFGGAVYWWIMQGGGDQSAAAAVFSWVVDCGAYALGALFLLGLVFWRMLVFFKALRVLCDRFVLHVPFIGPLITQGHAILFFTLLAVLLRSGVPLVPALKGIVAAHTNAYWRDRLQMTITLLERGDSFVDSAVALPLQSALTIFVAGIATATNAQQLALVCDSSAALVQEQRSDALIRFATLLPPALMLLIGLCIAAGLYSAFDRFSLLFSLVI